MCQIPSNSRTEYTSDMGGDNVKVYDIIESISQLVSQMLMHCNNHHGKFGYRTCSHEQKDNAIK